MFPKPLFTILVAAGFCLLTARSFGQAFQTLRFDENYSGLKDSVRNSYNRIKYIPLSAPGWFSADRRQGQAYLTVGGEVRLEFDAFHNEDWGQFNAGQDNFLLQRYDLFGDLHLSDRLRLFAQLRSALENGRPHGPRPIDEDTLNVENLFGDFLFWKKRSDSAILRVGRQELNYGSGRLISDRDGPNLRLFFTGIKAMYKSPAATVDAFAMEADTLLMGIFDNKGTKQLNLWGVYSSFPIPLRSHLDVYYIGIHNEYAVYEQGTNHETRHTGGLRIWRMGRGFNYDIESDYQTGWFGPDPIRAWAAFFDLNYSFANTRWNPLIGIRNDYTSGDRSPGDGRLETFNPLYPKAGYFSGFDPQLGAANLIDLHPYVSVSLLRNLSAGLDVVFNWRYSTGDGVYRPNGVLHLGAESSLQKYIGTATLCKVVYMINPFLNVNFGIQVFNTGPYIDQILPTAKSALLTNTQIGFMF